MSDVPVIYAARLGIQHMLESTLADVAHLNANNLSLALLALLAYGGESANDDADAIYQHLLDKQLIDANGSWMDDLWATGLALFAMHEYVTLRGKQFSYRTPRVRKALEYVETTRNVERANWQGELYETVLLSFTLLKIEHSDEYPFVKSAIERLLAALLPEGRLFDIYDTALAVCAFDAAQRVLGMDTEDAVKRAVGWLRQWDPRNESEWNRAVLLFMITETDIHDEEWAESIVSCMCDGMEGRILSDDHDVQALSMMGVHRWLRQRAPREVEMLRLPPEEWFSANDPWAPEERAAAVSELIDLARAGRQNSIELEARQARLALLLETGNLRAARTELDQCVRLANGVEPTTSHWLNDVLESSLSAYTGEFKEVERRTARLPATGRVGSDRAAEWCSAAQLMHVYRQQARWTDLETLLQTKIQQEPQVLLWRSARSLLACDKRLFEDAVQAVDELWERGISTVPRDCAWGLTMALLAEVCSALGGVDRAQQMSRLLMQNGGALIVAGGGAVCLGPKARYLGLLSTSMGEWDDAERHFQEAEQLSTWTGSRLWMAWTTHDHAGMLSRRMRPGDEEEVTRLLDYARTTAQDLGVIALTERISLLPPSDGNAVRSPQAHRAAFFPDGLTAREVEVLRLLAGGRSAKDIAAELVISVKTAENHTEHIYSKTGVSNRAEAATYAIRHGLVEP